MCNSFIYHYWSSFDIAAFRRTSHLCLSFFNIRVHFECSCCSLSWCPMMGLEPSWPSTTTHSRPGMTPSGSTGVKEPAPVHPRAAKTGIVLLISEEVGVAAVSLAWSPLGMWRSTNHTVMQHIWPIIGKPFCRCISPMRRKNKKKVHVEHLFKKKYRKSV